MSCRLSLETALNAKHLKFDPPERHELSNVNRYYYTQNLQYNGKDLMFTTDWFKSEGIRYGLDKKPEMLVPVSEIFHKTFNLVEDEAIRQLKVPAELQNNQSNENVFKRLPLMKYAYAKLNRDAVFFNKYCTVLKREELSYGEYRVILHVKGLYIGPHGQASKLASLQLRICQIQYCPIAVQCLFSTPIAPVAQPQNTTPMIPPQTPQPGVSKKLKRPTKLQRQNAVIEKPIREIDQRQVEQFPADFFADLDFDDNHV